MKKVDSTTWCPEENLAGKYLADILTKTGDKNLAQRVNNYLHKFNLRMHALNSLDKGMRSFYLDLLLTKTKSEVYKNIPNEKIKTLMLNIIKATFRNELLKINPKKK